MCVDCVLASLRTAQVDPGDEPLPEVVLSHVCFVLCFQHSRFIKNYPIMLLGDEPLLSQGGFCHSW
jgi:hypothetical protein